MNLKAIWYSAEDNVATALNDLAKGNRINLEIENQALEVILDSDIPSGHKFSLKMIQKGRNVIKYGESIGKATIDISKGSHVHVHNLESCRARGDLRGGN